MRASVHSSPPRAATCVPRFSRAWRRLGRDLRRQKDLFAPALLPTPGKAIRTSSHQPYQRAALGEQCRDAERALEEPDADI